MESTIVMWSVVESIVEWMVSFRILSRAPSEHFIHPFCCSAFGIFWFLLQHLFFLILRKSCVVSSKPINTTIIPVFEKAMVLSERFSIVSFAFGFHTHTTLPIQITAVTNHCILAGSFPTAYRTVAAVTQRLRGKSFAFFSFVNSALISSHSFRSQKCRGEVFSWFSRHHAELF